jgi:EmrB/QacA subfamily drug resistance transporter
MFETVTARVRGADPWPALWALLIGFFMILVDATIVPVANPAIMAQLGADYDAVIWVTSAYLLAYAVPLLVSGRLGDRYGPKTVYLVGLAVFTAASLWCGLSDSIGMLVAARVLQGVGAALLTPQTLTVITRTFPAHNRGVAMSVWGATAGVATLAGPLAGGVLVDSLGWQWIFIVNLPVGVLGFALAVWLVPSLPTARAQRFDLPGVVLSGVALFLIVFALQEGQSHDWAPWIWATIGIGIAVMAAFLYWQSVNTGEPLIPLIIFGDRNFSMSNLGVATIGFVATGMILPLMFYAQSVCGLTPTQAALLTAPMAVATGVLAPLVGKLVDRSHPRSVVGFGFALMAIGLTWLSIEMTPSTPIWRLVVPLTAMGVAMAFIWSPLAATATRNLPPQLAGAGSGVYNTTRQVGSVLGSAAMAALLASQLSAKIPGEAPVPVEGQAGQLPAFLHAPFAAAMSQAMLLPAFVALFGVIAALFLVGLGDRLPAPPRRPQETAEPVPAFDPDDELYWADGEDEYLEYEVPWDDGAEPRRPAQEADTVDAAADTDVLDPVTEPMHDGGGYPAPESAPRRDHADPTSHPDREWRSILDQLLDPPKPSDDPTGQGRNGFHVTPSEDGRGASRGRHSRD